MAKAIFRSRVIAILVVLADIGFSYCYMRQAGTGSAFWVWPSAAGTFTGEAAILFSIITCFLIFRLWPFVKLWAVLVAVSRIIIIFGTVGFVLSRHTLGQDVGLQVVQLVWGMLFTIYWLVVYNCAPGRLLADGDFVLDSDDQTAVGAGVRGVHQGRTSDDRSDTLRWDVTIETSPEGTCYIVHDYQENRTTRYKTMDDLPPVIQEMIRHRCL